MEKRKVLIDFINWLKEEATNTSISLTSEELIDNYLKSINTEEKIQEKEKSCLGNGDEYRGCTKPLSACKKCEYWKTTRI